MNSEKIINTFKAAFPNHTFDMYEEDESNGVLMIDGFRPMKFHHDAKAEEEVKAHGIDTDEALYRILAWEYTHYFQEKPDGQVEDDSAERETEH
jgi:hypothetical protein